MVWVYLFRSVSDLSRDGGRETDIFCNINRAPALCTWDIYVVSVEIGIRGAHVGCYAFICGMEGSRGGRHVNIKNRNTRLLPDNGAVPPESRKSRMHRSRPSICSRSPRKEGAAPSPGEPGGTPGLPLRPSPTSGLPHSQNHGPRFSVYQTVACHNVVRYSKVMCPSFLCQKEWVKEEQSLIGSTGGVRRLGRSREGLVAAWSQGNRSENLPKACPTGPADWNSTRMSLCSLSIITVKYLHPKERGERKPRFCYGTQVLERWASAGEMNLGSAPGRPTWCRRMRLLLHHIYLVVPKGALHTQRAHVPGVQYRCTGLQCVLGLAPVRRRELRSLPLG